MEDFTVLYLAGPVQRSLAPIMQCGSRALQIAVTYRMQVPLSLSLVMFAMAIPSLGFSLLPTSANHKGNDLLSKGVSLVRGGVMIFGQVAAVMGLFLMFLYLLPGAARAFLIVGGVGYLLMPLLLLTDEPLRMRLIFFVGFLIGFAFFCAIVFDYV